MTYHENAILNKLTVATVLADLEDEERDLIQLWMSNSFTLEEIGRVVGQKYHGKDIKPSVIRYHRDRILKKLQVKFDK